ncbi:coproporphyrinogen III oxidase, partial [Dolichospermum circinale CS-1225]|nr:coproporphyrinogen III oxidase [Dolichospermum circinale CS-1225]
MLTNSQTPTITKESSNFLPGVNAQARVSQFMQYVQDQITQGLEKLDGVG